VDAELPQVGMADRVRVDVPDWPGALSSSALGSVLLAPPPPGTPWRLEEAPFVDAFEATEGIEALALAPWHAAGAGGAGVKVAVFDVQWFNTDVALAELGEVITHDCETQRSCESPMDTLRPRFSWEEGSHGVACAEVIHDLAPEAELHLVRVNGLTTLENAVEWAIREEIDVVSMSMSFFNNSFHDGSGPLNDAAARLGNNGVLLVASAGNYAQEHWVGDWVDADHDGFMEFGGGSSYLPVYLGSGGGSAYVSWDEFTRCGRNDLDVIAVNRDGEIIGRAESEQSAEGDSCSPVERISMHADHEDWAWLRVYRKAGGGGVRVGVLSRGSRIYGATGGSLADPASNVGVFTVGAVRADGYAHNGPEFFSSLGPTRGGLAKPDIAGPDGLSTWTYGPTGFYGTSAATPAVAAAIAVALGEDGDADARTVADRLAADALGDRLTWQAADPGLGAGRARLWDPDADLRHVCGSGGGAAIVGPLLWWRRSRRSGACSR
jgi:hypothetical protein